MILESLKLRNYRNYQQEKVVLKNGMNIIIGDNGEGKTNILESIYLLSTTRSHRNDDDRELIMFDQEFASVEGNITDSSGDSSSLKIVLHRSGKTLMINENVIKKNSEFVGKINALLFTPTDMDLFTNSPRIRRRLFDIELGKLYQSYMSDLNIYLKNLKERNNYLKNQVTDRILLETFTELLYQPQVEIIKMRYQFIEKINGYLSYFYNLISDEKHEVSVSYSSFVKENSDDEIILSQIREAYDSLKERDIITRQTNTGIHRDDYVFFLDGRNVAKFSSQGQKRMVILALKLSIMQIIYQVKREYPIILLDDVFSELDVNKRNNLLNLLPASVQTIITTTDIKEVDISRKQNINILRIKKGRISYGN